MASTLSRGLVLATPPHVSVLVTPPVRARKRANPGTRRGLSRTLRRSQCWACWPPSRWIAQRCGSIRQQSPGQAPSALARCESAAVVSPPPRSASPRRAGWSPPRCRKPGMQATARVHRKPARRHQCVVLAALAPTLRASSEQLGLSDLDLHYGAPSSDEKESAHSQDSCVREPPEVGSTQGL